MLNKFLVEAYGEETLIKMHELMENYASLCQDMGVEPTYNGLMQVIQNAIDWNGGR